MSTNATQQIVNNAWNFAHVLRDDGLSYISCQRLRDQYDLAPVPSFISSGALIKTKT